MLSSRPPLEVAIAIVGLTISGCAAPAVQEFFRDETPHEAYQRSLSEAGLVETLIGQAWLDAASQALVAPPRASFPYQEEGVFRASDPSALGYELLLEQGQRIEIELELTGDAPTLFFLELFSADEEEGTPRPVLRADSAITSLSFEPRNGGRFILRLQPELLVDARYRLSIRADGSLAFPVEARGMTAILSYFGDERDAGRRSHHGVDIFAPRGTPAIAVADGVISRVEDTNLGGLVVWLRDTERNQSVYYAHLNEQSVVRGQRVQRGDTLGRVGNTGNARTTAPHLHFGIYRRGPINPWNHIRRIPQDPEPGQGHVDDIGTWVLVEEDGIRLRAAPSLGSPIKSELRQGSPLEVIASVGSWYRVRQPDGTQGFIARRLADSMAQPLRTVTLSQSETLWKAPLEENPTDAVPADTPLPVHGEYGGFLYVASPSGTLGWVRNGGSL